MILTNEYDFIEYAEEYDIIINFVNKLIKLVEIYGQLKDLDLDPELLSAKIYLLDYQKHRQDFINMKDILYLEYITAKDKEPESFVTEYEQRQFITIKNKVTKLIEKFNNYFNGCEQIYNKYKH